MFEVKVVRIGRSLGITLPADAARALRVKVGDRLQLTESPDGARITPYDPDFGKTMKIADHFISRYKNALRDLAK